MSFGFVPSVRHGRYYKLAQKTLNKLKSANLHIRGRTENEFELGIIAHLKAFPALRAKLITQVGKGERKILPAKLFGFKHKPDASIDRDGDGTAIEIKVINNAQSAREGLGQALAYRMHYRFVILVLVDQTVGQKVVKSCSDNTSPEFAFFTGLAQEMGIFSVVGPLQSSRNLVFFAD